jgi:hypothetical protein
MAADTSAPTTEERLDRLAFLIERLEYGLLDLAELMDSMGRRHLSIPALVRIKGDVDERRRVYEERRTTERLEAALAARRADA